MTPKYQAWRVARVSNVVKPKEEVGTRPQVPHPEIPQFSELDFLKQEYEAEKKKWSEEAKDLKRKLGDYKFEAERQALKTQKITEERDIARDQLRTFSQEQAQKIPTTHLKALEEAQMEAEYWKNKSMNDQRKWEDQCATMHSRVERYAQENERLRVVATEERTRATHLRTERNALNELAGTLDRELRRQTKDFREFVEKYEEQRQLVLELKEKYGWATLQNMEDQEYISYLTSQIDKAVVKANEMVTRVKELRRLILPLGDHSHDLEWLLIEVQDQYNQVRSFFHNEGLLK